MRKWSTIKQAVVFVILLTVLTAYKTLESPLQLRNQFLLELMAWHMLALVVILGTAWVVERRLLCNWFRCRFRKIAISRIAISLSLSSVLALGGILYYKFFMPGFESDTLFWRSVIFYALIYFIATMVMEVSKLVGKGFTEKLILGKYHLPKKEKMIFLFIDLKDSTKLSKELSLKKYSLFIKEFFRDIDMAVEKFEGEIYQYAGDQVIASWPALASNYNKAALSFIDFNERMKAKRSDYIQRYGVVPVFRAGLHSGNVVGTWMGRMKRELVFQGEVLNIAARVTSLAKNLSYPILLTQQIADKLTGFMRTRLIEAGSYSLKDVKMPMSIYLLRLEESNDPLQKTTPAENFILRNDAQMLQPN
jgi:adenylate cyclase